MTTKTYRAEKRGVQREVSATRRTRRVNHIIVAWMSVLFFSTSCVKTSSAQTSDEFQIQSTKVMINSDGEENDLCLQVRSPFGSGAKIVTKICADTITNQKFTVDEYGRFHTVNDEDLCITKLNGSSNIELADCGSEGSNENMFVLNAFDSANSINWRRNGSKVISVKGDQPVLNKPIKLRKRVLKGQMQNYHITPKPATILSEEDIPKHFHIRSFDSFDLDDTLMCLEAPSSGPGFPIVLNECEKGNPNQMWANSPTFGVIGLGSFSSSASVCIVKEANTLILGPCLASNSNKFMFNGVDNSIHWKKNGKKVIAVNSQGNVVLKNKLSSNNKKQRWYLDDIMTFNNEIVNVGIDCTDFFPMLRGCAICTGDCDTDSDCDGELRCAHRTRIDGQENVPGCVWGDDSDDLLMSNGDYCFLPTSQPGVINYVGDCSAENYLCGPCEGNCSSDGDCEEGLFCINRDGFEPVTGCTGEGGDYDMFAKGICSTSPQ